MAAQISRYIRHWIDDPKGGGAHTSLRDQLLHHDMGCPSLRNVWQPRIGGYSCISDFMECEGCGISFFWEGLYEAFEDCPESNHFYCRCCLDKSDACPCGKGREK